MPRNTGAHFTFGAGIVIGRSGASAAIDTQAPLTPIGEGVLGGKCT